MDIGVLINMRSEGTLLEKMQEAASLELTACQLCCWDTGMHSKELAKQAAEASKATGVKITGLWAGWSGPAYWNFTMGPSTLGIVPAAYRYQRMQELLSASEFADMMGVSDIITHAGFIPENMNDGNYDDVVAALSYLCKNLKAKGQNFLFETGQETPVTLLRTIERIGLGNAFINLDTGNLILYGKGNPLDAMDVFGKYVKNTHLKDGVYPVNGDQLGKETAFGKGKVDFAGIIKKIVEIGNDVPLIIEREISGPQQIEDIKIARDGLRAILADIGA
ncbi:MAG: sugar phosphate isomerase/epimerase [Clostridiales bacterium]|nr:sugar phosphate isomerase/epimerase [Clostridiales bacterium]